MLSLLLRLLLLLCRCSCSRCRRRLLLLLLLLLLLWIELGLPGEAGMTWWITHARLGIATWVALLRGIAWSWWPAVHAIHARVSHAGVSLGRVMMLLWYWRPLLLLLLLLLLLIMLRWWWRH